MVSILISARICDDFSLFQIAFFIFVLSGLSCIIIVNCKRFTGLWVIVFHFLKKNLFCLGVKPVIKQCCDSFR